MYETESFKKLQQFVSQNAALADLLELLPTETRIRIVIEDRIPARLIVRENDAILLAEDEHKPEWEIVLLPESIRLLFLNPPDSILEWSKTLVQFVVAGHIRFHPRLSFQEWWSRGYPQIAFKLKQLTKKS